MTGEGHRVDEIPRHGDGQHPCRSGGCDHRHRGGGGHRLREHLPQERIKEETTMVIVDARGLSCPEPVVMTRKAMADKQAQYQVLVDNFLFLL